MRALGLATILLTASLAAGCGERADAQTTTVSPTEGAPYVLTGTQVWSVPDPVSGRDYEVFVSLPASYATEPNRRYPVLYVTDADYAFPIIRQIARRVNLDGPVIEEFILVGLSYAVGEGGMSSRTRDYTPVRINDRTGGGVAYQAYLKTQALPFIEDRFRADPARR
ncbi:MAG: alpha/beta hydrolase-fold protein, partial [Brevundimonas sp.]